MARWGWRPGSSRRARCCGSLRYLPYEVEAAEEEILDQATAARTIAELKAEIETLKHLEALALAVRRSGEDTSGVN